MVLLQVSMYKRKTLGGLCVGWWYQAIDIEQRRLRDGTKTVTEISPAQ